MRWSEYRVRRTLRQSGQLQGKGKLVDQAKRMFLKAYALGLWSLEGKNYAEAAERLTEAGYPTSENDLKNAKRSKVAPETLWQLAESDKDVRDFDSALRVSKAASDSAAERRRKFLDTFYRHHTCPEGQ
jgi:tetratricopeptide (TPR) repeat protein